MAQYPPWTGAATADADGAATITYRPRSAGLTKVTQVSPECVNGSGALGRIRRNGALVTPFNPVADACSQPPEVWLWPGDELTAEWTGLTAGDACAATVYFELTEG